MVRGKTRHQLFLPDEMSRRLIAMAKSQKRCRSDLLLEMVETYMTRRSASQTEGGPSAKLDRLDREVRRISNEIAAMSHMLSRFIRHQVIYNASLPPPGEDAIALGDARYENLLDATARMMARRTGNGSEPPGESEASEA
jgi:hypothetical protein